MDREEQARGKQSAGVARWFQAHVSYPNRVSNKPKVAAGVSRDDVDEVAAGAARRDAAGREHGVGLSARRALALWLRSGRAEPVQRASHALGSRQAASDGLGARHHARHTDTPRHTRRTGTRADSRVNGRHACGMAPRRVTPRAPAQAAPRASHSPFARGAARPSQNWPQGAACSSSQRDTR